MRGGEKCHCVQLIIAESLTAERKAKMVFNCMGKRVGSNTEDPIKESDPGMPSDICHSAKSQRKKSGWRSKRLCPLSVNGQQIVGDFYKRN